MNDLEAILQTTNARISIDGRWLVFWQGEWTVFEHKYGAKKNITLYRGDSLNEATTALVGVVEEED